MNAQARIDVDRLYAVGTLMISDEGAADTAESRVWSLTCEAAQTLGSLPGLPRRGLPSKSAWPDFRDDNFFAVIREQISDNIEGEIQRIRFTPTAAAIDRCEVMWDLWRAHGFPKFGKRRELLRVVWLYAGGTKPAKIRQALDVSRVRLYRAKRQGCEGVAKKLGW